MFPLLSFVISAFRIVTWICFSAAFFSNEHYGKASFPPRHHNISWSRWIVSVDGCLVKFMSKYRNVIEWHSQLWFKVENVFRHNERNDNWLLTQSTWIFKTIFSLYLVIPKRQSPVKLFVWSKAKNVGLECAYIGIFELLTFIFTFFFHEIFRHLETMVDYGGLLYKYSMWLWSIYKNVQEYFPEVPWIAWMCYIARRQCNSRYRGKMFLPIGYHSIHYMYLLTNLWELLGGKSLPYQLF